MALSNHERVGRALEILNKGLKPFIEREMQAKYGDRWQQEALKSLRDQHPPGADDTHLDSQLLLLIIWDQWNTVFREVLGHAERSLVSELRETRNRWAHQKVFSTDDVYRALDSIQRLLTPISLKDAQEAQRQKQEILHIFFEQHTRRLKAAIAPTEPQPTHEDQEIQQGASIARRLASALQPLASARRLASALQPSTLGTEIATVQNPRLPPAPIVPPSVLGTDSTTGQLVTLEQEERLRGLYLVGKTDSGKTTLLVNMILDDMKAGRGICFLDPHGDAINAILARLPAEYEEKVILLDQLDKEYAFGLNLLQCADLTDEEQVSRTMSSIVEIFAKLFTEESDFSKEAQQTLQNAVYTMLDNPGTTIVEIPLLIKHEVARAKLIANIKDTHQHVREFWNRYNTASCDQQDNMAGSTLSKVDKFLSNAFMKHIVGQSNTTLHFRKIIEEGKILLVKLPRRDRKPTSLIGSMIVGQLLNAAFLLDQAQRPQFCLYIDEYQRFAIPSFVALLAEVRTFKIATCLAHEWRGQSDESDSLNAANTIVFELLDTEAQSATILTSIVKPVDWLLTHPHPHPAVQNFVEKWLKHLAEGVEAAEKEAPENSREKSSYRYTTEHPGLIPARDPFSPMYRYTIDALNKLLYEAIIAAQHEALLDELPIAEELIYGYTRSFWFSPASDYLGLLDNYRRFLSSSGVAAPAVPDLAAKGLELQGKIVALPAYVEGEIALLELALEAAELRLQEAYRQQVTTEVAAVRASIIIVQMPQRGLWGLSDVYRNAYRQNSPFAGPELPPRNALYLKLYNRPQNMVHAGYTFATWEEALVYFLNQHKKWWFQMNGEALLNKSLWTKKREKVYCYIPDKDPVAPHENADFHALKEKVYVAELEVWQLIEGIERSWYTDAMLEAEVARRFANVGPHPIVQEQLEEYVKFTEVVAEARAAKEQVMQLRYVELERVTVEVTKDVEAQRKQLEHEADLITKLAEAKGAFDEFVEDFTRELRQVIPLLATSRSGGDAAMGPLPSPALGHPTPLPSSAGWAHLGTREYSIQPLQLQQVDAFDAVVQTQRARIRAQNHQAGYTRKREEVRAEIAARKATLLKQEEHP